LRPYGAAGAAVVADGTTIMVDKDPLHALIETYGELCRQVAAEVTVSGGLHAVPSVAVQAVPGVDTASITRGRSATSWETVGDTNELARQANAIQYQLGGGPCVDAIEKDHVFRSADLATDRRWPNFGPVVADTLGLHSVLSTRLAMDEDNVMAGLNLYSHQRDAFDEQARGIAMLLATHAAVVVSRLIAREKAANLEIALASSREIGLAMGVLMNSHKITRDEAFDLLRIASQRQHRKLRDIAAEVAETGTIDI
jgi:GAF domain-containing protein